MTRDEVKRGVEEVILQSWDAAKATQLEAELHRRVLRAVSAEADAEVSVGLAQEALRTTLIDFPRRYGLMKPKAVA